MMNEMDKIREQDNDLMWPRESKGQKAIHREAREAACEGEES